MSRLLFSFLLIIMVLPLFAQDEEMSEAEIKLEDKAYRLFKENNFTEALPLFSQLLSLYPKEPDYNFGYAVCLIETNQEIEKAINYLKFAEDRSDNPVVKYYLGRAYHLNYKFDEAIGYYKVFKDLALPSELKKYPVDHLLEMCNNGKDLIRYISDLVVVENKKIKSENYFYSYELENFGGRLILKPEELKTKIDKKKETTTTVIFLSSTNDTVYYASYGNDKNANRDIYKSVHLKDGTWTIPENLGPVINTPFEEDYPFMHPDGKTLYFCSKGHNSMGGYDVFRSEYDTVNKAWSKPINLDFPTNTPYDDYLFVTDADHIYAYFASNRETSGGKITVYKIIVDNNPLERQFDNLDEIINKSRLEVSPQDEIEKAERSKQDERARLLAAAKQNNENNSIDNLAHNSSNQTNSYSKYKPVEYTPELTKENLVETAQTDIATINDRAEKIKKQSDNAFASSAQLIKKANEQRQNAARLSNSLKNDTDPIEKEKKENEITALIDEAENNEKQAIIAYNLGKNLDMTVAEMKKEADKTNNLVDAIKTSTSDQNSIESLVDAVNKNKERLEASENKFTSTGEIAKERNVLANEKQSEFENIKNQYEANTSDIAMLSESVDDLQKRIDAEPDFEKKKALNDELQTKTNQLSELQNQQTQVAQDYEKARIEAETAKLEADWLNSFENTSSENNLAASETPDKEELNKAIFDKELSEDVKNAYLIAETVKQNNSAVKEANALAVNDQNTYNENNNNSENQTNNENQTENNNITSADTINNSLAENANPENKNTDTIATNQAEDNNHDNLSNNQTSTYSENNNAEMEVQKLYVQSRRNEQLADSLNQLAELKTTELETENDPQKKAILENEINELKQLAVIKRNQADRQKTQAATKEKELIASVGNDNNIFTGNPTYPFADNTNKNSNLVKYQQETLNANYYDNLANEQERQLEVLRNSAGNITDPVTLQHIDDEIKELETLSKESHLIAQTSRKNAETLKTKAFDEIGSNDFSAEAMLLDATRYNAENTIPVTNDQRTLIKAIDDDKSYGKKLFNEINQLDNENVELESKLSNTDDAKEIKEIQLKIDNNNTERNRLNEEYATTTKNANKDEYDLYKDILNENRVINPTDKNAQLATVIEQEADVYYEKAGYIRNDATLIEDPVQRTQEYKKADNLEQIAVQKQKYAIDLYLKSKQPVENAIAENTNSNNNDSANTSQENANTSITLSPDDEERLSTYRQNTHKANILKTEGEKGLAEVASRKEKAASTFSATEKKDLLKDIDKFETKSVNTLLESYKLQGTADSAKYMVYKEQIEQLEKSSPDVENNKAIAKQYNKEADFYFSEASRIRENVTTLTNNQDRLNELKRAVDFENKALTSQELAVDVLTQIDPVFFVSTGELTKIDRLDALNQPVDVEKIIKIRTERIIEKLNLPEETLKSLDNANKNKEVADKLIVDAAEYQLQVKQLKSEQETAKTKDQKKLQKKIDALEKKQFTNLFTAAELYEGINDATYYTYKDNFKNQRPAINTLEARQGKQLEKDANDQYRKAKNLRDRAFVQQDPEKAYEMLKEAKKLEESAIENQEKAMGLYLNIEPLEDEIKLYAENQQKDNEFDNLIVSTKADITPIETPVDTSSENLQTDENLYQTNNTLANNENNTTEENNNATSNNDNENNSADTRFTSTENDNQNQDSSLVAENNTLVPPDTTTQSTIKNINTDTNNNIDSTLVAENTTNENDSNNSNNQSNTSSEKNITTDQNSANSNNEISPVNNDTNQETENNTINNTTDNTSTNNETIRNNQPPDTNTEKTVSTDFNYSILPVQAYSSANPIPINVELPSGLVFKVQIGAFRIEPDYRAFKGINPITGEKLPESTLTRYMVGLFRSIEGASLVREEVKTMGFRDAFIVAYKDGKRISLYEARRLMQNGATPEGYNEIAQNEVDRIKNRVNTTNIASNNIPAETNQSSAPVAATDLTKTTNLLYTVQIGVYKNPVSASVLKNLNPIYQEQTPYGFIRYTTGIFTDVKSATTEKNRIVQLGISDAFVSAYHNGKKISLQEASALENQGTVKMEETNVKYPEQEVQPSNTSINTTINKSQITFRVQIGAYKEQVPTAVVSQFLTLAANHGLDQTRDENGSTIYSVGQYKTYDEAVRMKEVLVNEGIKDAFVTAWAGDKKIPVNEAISVLNQ